jgi:replication-associated recombination protein RarA
MEVSVMATQSVAESTVIGPSRKPLYEKYRPATWQEVIAQDKVVKQLTTMSRRDGLAGRAYWLSGGSGQGKSSIARLIGLEIADEFFIEDLDASALTVPQVRELEDKVRSFGWTDKPGRAVLVNESHGLRKDVIRQLLVTLERVPSHVAWIFTTTIDGQESLFDDQIDASPLLSRCLEFPLARRGLAEPFAIRAQEIAWLENLDGRPSKITCAWSTISAPISALSFRQSKLAKC